MPLGGSQIPESLFNFTGIRNWIQFYNQKRPHQALKMKTPAQAYAEAA
ncbi:integrase core domain-containing protein [Aeromonas veronii]